MNKIYSSVITLAVLLSITMSAAAFEQKTMTRTNGEMAYASWENGNLYSYVNVWETNTYGTELYLGICIDSTTCYYGYQTILNNNFDVAKQLKSATLTSGPIYLQYCYDDGIGNYVCNEKQGTIDLTWIGEGSLATSKNHYLNTYNGYSYKSMGTSSYRLAKATGSITIGGVTYDLGDSYYGEIDSFKTAEISMTK
jgi:hypothetical protein